MFPIPVPSQVPAWPVQPPQAQSVMGTTAAFMQSPYVAMQPFAMPHAQHSVQPAAMAPMMPQMWGQANPWAQQHAEYWNQAAAMQAAQAAQMPPHPHQFVPPTAGQPQAQLQVAPPPQAEQVQPPPEPQAPPAQPSLLPAPLQPNQLPAAPTQPVAQPQSVPPPEPAQPPPPQQHPQQQISEQQQQAYNLWMQQQQQQQQQIQQQQQHQQQPPQPQQPVAAAINEQQKQEAFAAAHHQTDPRKQKPKKEGKTVKTENSIPTLTSQQQSIIKNFTQPVPPQDPRETIKKPIDPLREPPPPPPPKKSDSSKSTSRSSTSATKQAAQGGSTLTKDDIHNDVSSSSSSKSETMGPPETLSSLRTQLETLEKQIKTYQIEYQKWHQDFVKWQKQHQNHPDQKKYIDYQKQYQKMIEEQQSQLKQQYAELQKKINKRKEEQKAAAAAKTVSLILSTAAKKTKASNIQLQQLQQQQQQQEPMPPQQPLTPQVHDESPPPPPPPPGSPGYTQRDAVASTDSAFSQSSANDTQLPVGNIQETANSNNPWYQPSEIVGSSNDQPQQLSEMINYQEQKQLPEMINYQEQKLPETPSNTNEQSVDKAPDGSVDNITNSDEEIMRNSEAICEGNDDIPNSSWKETIPLLSEPSEEKSGGDELHRSATQDTMDISGEESSGIEVSSDLDKKDDCIDDSPQKAMLSNSSQGNAQLPPLSVPKPILGGELPPRPMRPDELMKSLEHLSAESQRPMAPGGLPSTHLPTKQERSGEATPSSQQPDQNSYGGILPQKLPIPGEFPPLMGHEGLWLPPGIPPPPRPPMPEFASNSQLGNQIPWPPHMPPRPPIPSEFPPTSQMMNQTRWPSDVSPPRQQRPPEFPPNSQMGYQGPWQKDLPPRPGRPDEFLLNSSTMTSQSPWVSSRSSSPPMPDKLPPPPHSQMGSQGPRLDDFPRRDELSERRPPLFDRAPMGGSSSVSDDPRSLDAVRMEEEKRNTIKGREYGQVFHLYDGKSPSGDRPTNNDRTDVTDNRDLGAERPGSPSQVRTPWLPRDAPPRVNEPSMHTDRPPLSENGPSRYPPLSNMDEPPRDRLPLHTDERSRDRPPLHMNEPFRDRPHIDETFSDRSPLRTNELLRDRPPLDPDDPSRDHPPLHLNEPLREPYMGDRPPLHTDAPNRDRPPFDLDRPSRDRLPLDMDERLWDCPPSDDRPPLHPSDPSAPGIMRRPLCENFGTMCRFIPKCGAGNKCKFQHPLCRLNNKCADPGCPFEHTVDRDMDAVRANQYGIPEGSSGKDLMKLGPTSKAKSKETDEPAFSVAAFVNNKDGPAEKKEYPKPASVEKLEVPNKRTSITRDEDIEDIIPGRFRDLLAPLLAPHARSPPKDMHSRNFPMDRQPPCDIRDFPPQGFPPETPEEFLHRHGPPGFPPGLPGFRPMHPQLGPGIGQTPDDNKSMIDTSKGARIPPPVDYSSHSASRNSRLRDSPRDLPQRDMPTQDIHRDTHPGDTLPNDILSRDIHPRDMPPREIPPRGFPEWDFPPRDLPPRGMPASDFPSRERDLYLPRRDLPPRDLPLRDCPRSSSDGVPDSPSAEEEHRRQLVLGMIGNAPLPPRMPDTYRKRDLPPGMIGSDDRFPKQTRLEDSLERDQEYERRRREILGAGGPGGPGMLDEDEKDLRRMRPPSPGYRDEPQEMSLRRSPPRDGRFNSREDTPDRYPKDVRSFVDDRVGGPVEVYDYSRIPPNERRTDERPTDSHAYDRVPPLHRYSDSVVSDNVDRRQDDDYRRSRDHSSRDPVGPVRDRLDDSRDHRGSPHRDSPSRSRHDDTRSQRRNDSRDRDGGHSKDHRDSPHRDRDRDSNQRDRDRSRNVTEAPPLNSPSLPPELKPEVFSASDIFDKPGRETRPKNIVIILRGIPGSGKSYMAKVIKEKESENGGQPPRILALDDYFMLEVEKKDKKPGKGHAAVIKKQEYIYEAEMEDAYRASLLKAFNKTLNDGFFPMVIVDAINHKTSHFDQFWSAAKHKGFEVFISELKGDTKECLERSEHKRSDKDIKNMIDTWESAPAYYKQLDISSFLQDAAIDDVEMEEAAAEENSSQSVEEKKEDEEDEDLSTAFHIPKSKWEDSKEVTLAKLDGVSKRKTKDPKSKSPIFDDVDDEDDPYDEKEADIRLGKKRVRWADIEEKKQLDHQKKIGFSIGMDWNIFTDPNAQIPK